MTTKVVKGSLWTLAGQVLPLGISLITSPIVIRLLGAEGYGVMLLVLLIPGYFSFADFGMGMASTKFGSEAHASGSREKEAGFVRNAALISLAASVPIAVIIFAFASLIIEWFGIPEKYHGEAALSLRIAAITFVINLLCLVFNTPQLTRLRMDLNTLINAGFRVIGMIAIPIVIYLGGGIVGALIVLMAVSIATLFGHIVVSGRLLPELFQTTIDRTALRPMLKFGGSLVVGGVAAALLINLEKFVLTRVTSVETLAYYSVATNLAGMITLMSASMIQSLIPAFSQLQGTEKRQALNSLYSRGIRVNLIWLVPAAVLLSLGAKPFFTIWFGESFGRESSVPFYVLLLGLVFNVMAYLPYVAIIAAGRTDVFAKLYWFELFPYIALVTILTIRFGAVGTAAAWTVRISVDAVLLFWLSKKVAGVTFSHPGPKAFALAFLVMLFPFIALLYFGELNPVVIIITLVCTAIYVLIVWKGVLERGEIEWLTDKLYLKA